MENNNETHANKTPSSINSDGNKTIDSLYKESLFLQAYRLGIKMYGEVDLWPSPDLKILSAHILRHLGSYRKADAIYFKLWRQEPSLKSLSYYAISAHHQWHGPLVALDKLNSIIEKTIDEEDKAQLLVNKALIMMEYRDFNSAENCLNSIQKPYRDHWVELQYAELKKQQDDYHTALAITDTIVTQATTYRPAIQKKAALLQLLNRNPEAIHLLQELWKTTESWWVGKQLFQLLLDERDHKEAAIVLNKIKELPPIKSKETSASHNLMQADLLCAQGKYNSALPYLETKSFFHSTVKKTIQESRASDERKVLEVPFTRQANMTCAPASLTSVSTFFERPVNQQDIIDAICYGGTQAQDERKWIEDNNWHCCEFDLNFNSIKQLIDLGIPVLFATVDPGSAHLQIIVGYDEKMGTYLLRDPYYPRLQEFLINECEKYYAASGPRCMVMAPKHLAENINSINLPAKELYDYLYTINIALDNNNRSLAKNTFEELKEKHNDHRLSITGERKIAFYDRDEIAILATTEKLLEKFPNDINYQISKVSSLKNLEASTRALNYLENLSCNNDTHFLILSRLADELREDHRQSERTENIYKKLLRINPLHTITLYGYAGVLWDKKDYIKSYQLYRFCSCLDDTNENYTNSFFKAARFHKQTDQAIDFLIDRFERFGKQSSGPAISLYKALDSLNRTHEGLKYLDQAMEKRPEDGDLLLFIARTWAYTGRHNEAKRLLETSRPYCNTIRFNETAAEIYEITLETSKALEYCQKVIALEPLNYLANQSYVRLLVEQGDRKTAIGYLREQLTKFPENASLQRLLIDWIDPDKPELISAAYLDYCQSHPNDTHAKRGLSANYITLGDYKKAIITAKEAIDIDTSDCRNYGYLGDAYLADNQFSLANNAFKDAIKHSCDYSYAFNRLLETSRDTESQKEAAKFIHHELMHQVSYGDGILDFERAAFLCFSSQQIKTFLDHAIEIRPDLWQSWAALTIHLRENNHSQKALETIDSAIKKFPLIPKLHYEKSKILKVMHKDKKAIECLQYTLQLSPAWIGASNELCTLYEQAGNYDAALSLQKKAIQYNPLSASPYGFMADILEKTDQVEQAIDALKKAIERDISYSWAWRKYFYLSHNKSSVLDELKNHIIAWPENSELLNSYAELTNQNEDSIKLIENYLIRKPHHMDMCIKLINFYTHNNNIEKAKELVSEHYWNHKRPIAIIANEAWIYSCEDNYEVAIDIMRNVSLKSPNYYDAWRYLAIWNTKLKNITAVENAIENCARIHPHDESVLCFCAEKLQSVGSKKDISTYLKHAFELDVTDQYNGLTYVDYLLQSDKIEEAETAQNILLTHRKNPYVYLRSLRISAKKGNKDDVLLHFKNCLGQIDESNSIIYAMWGEICNSDLEKNAADIIKELKATENLIDENAGKCLGEFDLTTLSLGKFQKQLPQKIENTVFFHRYLEAYIRLLSEQNRTMPNTLETRLLPSIKQDTLNWALLGFNQFQNNSNRAIAAQSMAGLESCDNVEPWMLYYFSMACCYSGNWEKGMALIAQAYQLPNDHFRNDIIIWYIFERLVRQQDVDIAPLIHIAPSELESISLYILASAKVLSALVGTDFVENYHQLSPLLRQCQREIQHYPNDKVIKKAKSIMKQRLKHSLPPMPFLKSLFWKWRLSNHF